MPDGVPRCAYEDANQAEDPMEKDVVCGMQVDPARAAGTSEYQGKTYYFCAKSCKAKFDANPQQYVK
jgi:Cu+-exporting ATPase